MDTHERPVSPAFLVDARTVALQDFFAHGDLGFFIPMLMPTYSWRQKEASLFLADIVSCVHAFLDNPSAIHHFGSIILQDGFDATECVRPIDRYALPQRIYTIIDGQQRLTTIALIACCLYRKLGALRVSLVEPEHALLRQHIDHLQEQLLKCFSCEIRGASSQSKPIIVHGRSDFWANTDDQAFHHSSIGEYLFKSLAALWNEEPAPTVSRFDELYIAVGCIESWLHYIIAGDTKTNYPTPWNIRSGLHWLHPLLFVQPLISVAAVDSLPSEEAHATSFIQLFALTHTFLQRCCFTVVMPTTYEAALSITASHQYKDI